MPLDNDLDGDGRAADIQLGYICFFWKYRGTELENMIKHVVMMGHLQKSHQPNTYNTWSLEKEALKNAEKRIFFASLLGSESPRSSCIPSCTSARGFQLIKWCSSQGTGWPGWPGWLTGWPWETQTPWFNSWNLHFPFCDCIICIRWTSFQMLSDFQVSTLLYFGYMFILSLIFGLLTGSIGLPRPQRQRQRIEAPHVLARKSLGSWSEIRTFPEKKPVLGQFQVPEIPIGPRTASFYFVRTIYGSIKVDWCWPWWSLPSILFWGYQKSQRCRPPEPNSNEVGRVYARWVFGWRRMLTYSHDFTCIHSTSIIDLWFQKTITNLSFLLRLRCYIFLEIMGRSRVVDSQTAGSAGLPARQSAVVIGVIGVLKSLESLQFQIDGDADWPWL